MANGMPGGAFGAHAMASSYDARLVALSVVIAMLGSYAGFTLVHRIAVPRWKERLPWLLMGAAALGSAVWAMHFTGMLAFRLPVAVGYDIPLVVLSLIVAMGAGAATLLVISRSRLSWQFTLLAATIMGAGIGSMHYIGMAAMRMPAATEWDWRIIALSVMVAVGASYVSLRITYRLRFGRNATYGWARVLAAAVLGIAIAAMHYTGMAAASFVAAAGTPVQASSSRAT